MGTVSPEPDVETEEIADVRPKERKIPVHWVLSESEKRRLEMAAAVLGLDVSQVAREAHHMWLNLFGPDIDLEGAIKTSIVKQIQQASLDIEKAEVFIRVIDRLAEIAVTGNSLTRTEVDDLEGHLVRALSTIRSMKAHGKSK